MWIELSTCTRLRLKKVIKKLANEFSVSLKIIFEVEDSEEKLTVEIWGVEEKLGYGPRNHPTKI